MTDLIKPLKLERIPSEHPEDDELEHRSKRLFTPREFVRSMSFVLPNIFDFRTPENPPKYFAIDVDNTFFHTDKGVFARNTHAFTKVRNLGYQPFLCTARPLSCIPYMFGHDFFEKTGYRGYPGIFLNGTVIYDKTGKLINLTSFSRAFMDDVLEYIRENNKGGCFLFWTLEGHYAVKPLNELLSFTLSGDGIPKPELKTPEEIAQMQIVSVSSSETKMKLKNTQLGVDYSTRGMGMDHVVEFCPSGVTKAKAIETLMKHENLKPQDCGFIGDGDNDIDSMKLCELSFAVGNATNFVKKHAKWVLHRCYYDGAFCQVMDLVYKIYRY